MNIKEEIEEFTKLIKRYPDISDLYIGRAVLYAKIGEYEKACPFLCLKGLFMWSWNGKKVEKKVETDNL